MTDKTPVTVLGLGRMGTTIAGLLARAGHPVTVWNRTPGKAADLVEEGAVEARTAAEALAASPVSIAIMRSPEDTREVLDGASSVLSGRTVINLSTGRPDQARDLGERLAGQGASYLDGGILGVTQTMGTPAAVIGYSGTPAAQEAYGSLMDTLGTALYLGPDFGEGSRRDLATLGGMYGLLAGAFQALATVRGGDDAIDLVEFTRGQLVPWLEEVVRLLPAMAAEIGDPDNPVTFSDLDANHYAVGDILRATRDAGASPELLQPLLDAMERQVAKGFGKASFTRVVDELRPV